MSEDIYPVNCNRIINIYLIVIIAYIFLKCTVYILCIVIYLCGSHFTKPFALRFLI